MLPDTFVKPVIQALTGLAKERYEQWKINSAIERDIHAEITNVVESIERLSFDAAFSHNIFRLAAGETVDAGTLVALRTAVTRNGKPIVSEAELTARLKDFAYKLVNAWQVIFPKSGDAPTAFAIFRDKIDALTTGEAFAKKKEKSAEALAMRLVETHQHEFQQREQAYQDYLGVLTAAVTALAQQRTQSDAPPGIDDALARLAEAIFQALAERKAPNIQEAAAALRHLGGLALWHDTPKTLQAYRRAVARTPENAEGRLTLGHLLHRIGHITQAVDADHKALAIGEEANNQGLIADAYANLGNVYWFRGEIEPAEAIYRQALTLFQEIGAAPQVEHVQESLRALRVWCIRASALWIWTV